MDSTHCHIDLFFTPSQFLHFSCKISLSSLQIPLALSPHPFPNKSKSKTPFYQTHKKNRRKKKLLDSEPSAGGHNKAPPPPPPPVGESESCRVMAWNQHCLFFALLFLFIAFTYSHSSSFLSYEVLKAGKPTGRSLLQAIKNCPIDMEGQNYTILTSKCKGPKYPPKVCCDAFLEFCCGFVDELNDLTTNCADTMFSYINLYGQYPPGLFANQCKGDKEGLSCENFLTSQDDKTQKKVSSTASPHQITRPRLHSLALAPLVMLYFLF